MAQSSPSRWSCQTGSVLQWCRRRAGCWGSNAGDPRSMLLPARIRTLLSALRLPRFSSRSPCQTLLNLLKSSQQNRLILIRSVVSLHRNPCTHSFSMHSATMARLLSSSFITGKLKVGEVSQHIQRRKETFAFLLQARGWKNACFNKSCILATGRTLRGQQAQEKQ